MIEVELKAALTGEQAAGMEQKLLQLQFADDALVQEIDVYFNGTEGRDFRKTDEALRLRTCKDLKTGTGETLMTYKGPKLDERSSTRKEYETAVGDLEVAKNLLQALGFVPLYTVDKTRHTLVKDGMTVCLDQVRGLGAYMELEILQETGSQEEAVDQLLHMLDTLGVSRDALTRKSYLELLVMASMKK